MTRRLVCRLWCWGAVILTALAFSPIALAAAPVAGSGYGLGFNGGNHVEVADHAALDLSSTVTVEAWIKRTGTGTGYFNVLSKSDLAGTVRNYNLYIYDNNGDGTYGLHMSTSGAGTQTIETLNSNAWYHVAVSVSSAGASQATIKYYVNGALVQTDANQATTSAFLATNNDPLRIGMSDNNFVGEIDEVRVWNTERTAAEISANYNRRLGGGEVGLAGYWRFDEAAGTTAADSGPNGLTGTLVSSPAWTANSRLSTSFTTNEDNAVSGYLDAYDADNDALTYSVVTLPANGTVTITDAAYGGFTYTPAADWNGGDSFTFKVNDGTADSTTATANITVDAVNDAPVAAVNQPLTLNEGASGTIGNTLLRVTDVDNTTAQLTFTVVTAPLNGTVYKNGVALVAGSTFTQADIDAGSISYTHNGGETTGDALPVTVSDGAGGSIPTYNFWIDVTPVNDAPTASNGAVTTNEDTAYTFQATDFNFSDADGDPLSKVRVTSLEAAGSLEYNSGTWDAVTMNQEITKADIDAGKLRFVPAPNANGAGYASFGFRVHDGTDYSAAAYTMTIDVTAVNDAPVVQSGEIIMDEDVPLTAPAPGVLETATDAEGDALTAVLVAGPSNGTLTFNADGSFTYTPNADFNGSDSFTYKANDGTADSNVATMAITVMPVNDAPTASNNTVTTNEDTAHTFAAGDFNFSDVDTGDSLTKVQVTTLESAGVLEYNNGTSWVDVTLNQEITKADIDAGKLRFVPAANANGAGYASFGFRVHDGTDYSAAAYTMTVNVTAVNDAPSFTKGANQTVDEDAGAQTVAGWATGMSAGPADESGQTLTFNVTNNNNSLFSVQPAIAANGTLTYTPAPDANGSATVTVTLQDDGGTANGGVDTSAPQTFTITVTRAVSANADLSGLTVSAGTLSPTFAPATVSYAVYVSNAVTGIDVTATVADAVYSGLTINGTPRASGEPRTVSLSVGENLITIVVTAGDRVTTKTYTVTVTRRPASSGGGITSTPPPSQIQIMLPGEVTVGIDPTAGGSGEDSTGTLKLEFPAGAIEVAAGAIVQVSVTEISTTKVEQMLRSATMPDGFQAIGRAFEFKAEVTSGGATQAVTSFAKPVIFTVALSADDLKTVTDPEKVGLFRLNDDGTLTFVGGRLVDGKLIVEMHGFSRYLLAEVKVNFPDLAGHWAKGDVELMASKYIVKGLPDGSFDPAAPVTRAQFAAMLARAIGLPAVAGGGGAVTFSDVKPDDWFHGEVMAAVRAGIIKGYEDGTFRPDAPVTREQVAVMVARALRARGKAAALSADEAADLLASFADRGDVAGWAAADLALAVKEGIVKGKGADAVAPGAGATRAEAAVMIARFWRK